MKKMKAILDVSKVLIGFSSDHESSGIDVPDDCDLIPHKYIYDGEKFHPIIPHFTGDTPSPDFQSAMVMLSCAMRDRTPLPAPFLSWLKSEETALRQTGKII